MLRHKTWAWKHRGNFLLLPLNLNGWRAEQIEVHGVCQPHGQETQKSAYDDVRFHMGYGIWRFIARFSFLLTQKLSSYLGIQKQFHSHCQVLVSTVAFSCYFKEKKEDWRLNLHSFFQGASFNSKGPPWPCLSKCFLLAPSLIWLWPPPENSTPILLPLPHLSCKVDSDSNWRLSSNFFF